MLFIHPMWDHESQRIGKQMCTPLGYKLHGIAELIGFIGLLLLIVIGASLGIMRAAKKFPGSLFWLMAVPFALGLISEGLMWYSWRLAAKKGFHYDYETQEASWMENGERRVYKWRAS